MEQMSKSKVADSRKGLRISSESNSKRVKLQTPVMSADTWLFVIVFGCGTLFIIYLNAIAGKPSEMDDWEISKRIFPLFFLMLAYAIVVARAPKFLLASWQAGDNCYYLGFLFTLVSLVFALYDFVESGGNKVLVVQDFGIALSTTIAGLLLRVLFSQARLDPDNIEATARAELFTSGDKLRRQLDGITVDFHRFRRNIEQSVTDMNREQHTRNCQLWDEVLDQQKKVVENWSKAITQASLEYTDSTNSLKMSTKDVEKALSKYAETVESNISRFENQSASIDHFNEGIMKLKEQFSSLMSLSEVINDELVEKMRDYTKKIKVASSELESGSKSLANSSAAYNEIVDELNKLKSALNQLPDSIRKTIVNEHSIVTEEWSKNAKNTSEELVKNSSIFSSATETATNAINTLAQSVHLKSKSFEEQQNLIEQLNSSMSALNKQVNDVGKLFANEKLQKIEAFISELTQLISLLEANKDNLGNTGESVAAISKDLQKIEPLLKDLPSSLEQIDKLIDTLKPKTNILGNLFGRDKSRNS